MSSHQLDGDLPSCVCLRSCVCWGFIFFGNLRSLSRTLRSCLTTASALVSPVSVIRMVTGLTQFKVPVDMKIGTLDSLMVRALACLACVSRMVERIEHVVLPVAA